MAKHPIGCHLRPWKIPPGCWDKEKIGMTSLRYFLKNKGYTQLVMGIQRLTSRKGDAP